jgi:hypothetical protein
MRVRSRSRHGGATICPTRLVARAALDALVRSSYAECAPPAMTSFVTTSPRLPWLSLTLAMLIAGVAASCSSKDDSAAQPSELSCEVKPSQAFHDRIEPLLADDNVSTCNQCHLSGVNLSAFVRETPCKTLACLIDQGLLDLEVPRESTILDWIKRATPDNQLITQDVIRAEHDGFLEWIEANAACPDACAGVACGSPAQGPRCANAKVPELPPEPAEGCTDSQLEQAFYDQVYAWRGRCYPCHFDTELDADPDAPRWLSAKGNCETGSVASLKRMLALGLIDTASPEESLLLLKPLDTAQGGVMHGGGNKFQGRSDPAYVSFLQFIDHYAACQALD